MKISMRNLIAVTGALLALAPCARADVKLPAIFSDHMVLQAGTSVPVWGWAASGEEVTVTIAGQTKKVSASTEGKWQVKLDPLPIGTPATLTVKGKNTITVTDVLVGDVWLCSGQSNMAMGVGSSKDFDKEKAAANYPNIRMFQVNSGNALVPQDDCAGKWVVCATNTVGGFSATAYFFGREIHQQTGQAIGLINSSVGGTPIEAWTSLPAQQARPELKPVLDRYAQQATDWNPDKAQAEYAKQLAAWKEAAAKAKTNGKPAPRQPSPQTDPRLRSNYPASLFNGKIAPLIPYALHGGIWYQGEANANSAATIYGVQLTTLIQDWRNRWGNEFPFAWVQLPEWLAVQTNSVEESAWAVTRTEMLQPLKLPRTGIAIALGTGDAKDIHPKNKQEVGHRLAIWALATVYGRRGVAWAGPLLASHKIVGNEVVINFTHTEGGLMAPDSQLKGFAIAGADKKWLRANARIAGDTVIVWHPSITTPVAVRYAWANNPVGAPRWRWQANKGLCYVWADKPAGANLCNGAGLPASPFRTDVP